MPRTSLAPFWSHLTRGLLLLGAFVPMQPALGDVLEGLSRVRYQRLGETRVDVGELSYGDGKVQLRLFSDRLGAFYVVHLVPEDLLEIDRLPADEAEQIHADREVVRERKQRERDEARRVREAAKAAAEREARRQGDLGPGRRSSRPIAGRDGGGSEGGSAAELRLPSIDETIADLELAVARLTERISLVREQLGVLLPRLQALAALPKNQVGSTHRDLQGVGVALDEITEKLARRERDLEALYEGRAERTLTPRVALEWAELGHRRLEPIDQALTRAAARADLLSTRVEGLRAEAAAEASRSTTGAASEGRSTADSRVEPGRGPEARPRIAVAGTEVGAPDAPPQSLESEVAPALDERSRSVGVDDRQDADQELRSPQAVAEPVLGSAAGAVLASPSAVPVPDRAAGQHERFDERSAESGEASSHPAAAPMYWILAAFSAMVLGLWIVARKMFSRE